MLIYKKGDLFKMFKTSHDNVDRQDNVKHVIVHIVNDVGAWGAGFVLNLSRYFPEAEKHYKTCWKTRRLGDVDVVRVDKDVYVANVYAQHGLRSTANRRPVNYDASVKALYTLREILKNVSGNIEIHMPKIGCGLGGGNWLIMETIVSSCLSGHKVNVYEL